MHFPPGFSFFLGMGELLAFFLSSLSASIWIQHLGGNSQFCFSFFSRKIMKYPLYATFFIISISSQHPA